MNRPSLLKITEAFRIIDREIQPAGSRSVGLDQVVGCVLAEDITADSDLPPFDRSQMDGYAVRSADTANAPVKLKLVGESAAGRGWHKRLRAGEAVRIMTGAVVPKGADAVQKLEMAAEGSDIVDILQPVRSGSFIVEKGSEIKAGDVVFSAGRIVTPNMVSSLAAFGRAETAVASAPKIAIVPTGSEIVPVADKPGRDQIRDSNSHMLEAFCDAIGCSAKIFPLVGDDLLLLNKTLASAAGSCDILVVTGGVSVGKYDLTKTALAAIGGQIIFDRVDLKPGKPTVFAKLGDKPVFGLPGNPVSAAVTFQLFVRRAVRLLQSADDIGLRSGFAVCSAPAKAAKDRFTLLPVSLKTDKKGRLKATPLRWLGSSDLVGFSRAEALICLAAGRSLKAGDKAAIYFL